MQVDITGRHMEVTDPMARQIQEHVDKLPRFDNKIQYLTITLDSEGANKMVEIIAKCHRSDLFAEAQSHDMYQCIDEAFAKIERQIRRLHDKLTEHGQKPGQPG